MSATAIRRKGVVPPGVVLSTTRLGRNRNRPGTSDARFTFPHPHPTILHSKRQPPPPHPHPAKLQIARAGSAECVAPRQASAICRGGGAGEGMRTEASAPHDSAATRMQQAQRAGSWRGKDAARRAFGMRAAHLRAPLLARRHAQSPRADLVRAAQTGRAPCLINCVRAAQAALVPCVKAPRTRRLRSDCVQRRLGARRA